MELQIRPEFFTVVLIISHVYSEEVMYNDLVELEASCSPLDTCVTPRDEGTDTLLDYRCECKPSCFKFDTCCIDSPNIRLGSPTSRGNIQRGTCEKVFKSNVTTYMVSRCDPNWSGGAIFKAKCEKPFENFKDPVTLKPVTSLKSTTTYRNYFCAICNDDIQPVQSWDISPNQDNGVNREELLWGKDETHFSEKLVYVESSNEWGLITEDDNGNMAFVNMKINVLLPPNLRDVVPSCIPDLVSHCHELWTDESVREKCAGYMAVVYIIPNVESRPVTYRNVHCAICNFESFSRKNICEYYGGVAKSAKIPLSFTVLLDVNLKDGDKVGEVFPCDKGQIYDSLSKKCRKLECGIPEYTIKDGQCVPPDAVSSISAHGKSKEKKE